MNHRPIALWLLLALLVAGLAHAAFYYPRLPGKVASHFGAAGEAQGWSSRTTLVGVHLATLTGTALLMLGLPWLLGVLPARWISLPHRDYWLAPGRRDETLRWIGRQMLWFGSATLALLIGVGDLAFRANLRPRPALGNSVWWLLGAYLLFVAVWTVRLHARFWRVPRG